MYYLHKYEALLKSEYRNFVTQLIKLQRVYISHFYCSYLFIQFESFDPSRLNIYTLNNLPRQKIP